MEIELLESDAKNDLLTNALRQASVLLSATSGGTVSRAYHSPFFSPGNASNHFFLLLLGFHLPRVRERDTFYARLEAERAAGRV